MFTVENYSTQYQDLYKPDHSNQEYSGTIHSLIHDYFLTIEQKIGQKKIELNCFIDKGAPLIDFKNKTYKDLRTLEHDLPKCQEKDSKSRLLLLAEAANFLFGNMMFTFEPRKCPKKEGETLTYYATSDQNGRLYKASCALDPKRPPSPEYSLSEEYLN